MIHLKIQDVFSLLLAIPYTYYKNEEYNYSLQPRPCHNIVFLLEGEGIIEAEGKTIPLKEKNILFIPKSATYKAKWSANPKTVFHSIHFSFHSKNDPLFNKNIPIQLLDNTNFDDLFRSLMSLERYQYSQDADSFFAVAAFYNICGSLLRNVELNRVHPFHTSLLPAITYLQHNYRKHFTVEKLAALCNLSISRFYFLFKKETGDSPIVYKNKIAIQNSTQELLYDKEITIKELARKYGFESPIYFERLFKKQIGKTPSQYRKEENLL